VRASLADDGDAMNIRETQKKLLDAVSQYRSLMICIQGSPDPDVIASSYALKLLCEKVGVKAEIFASSEPSLPQNRAIVEQLDIPITYASPAGSVQRFNAYAVLDFQSAFVKGVTGTIECAVHIDHHEPVKESVRPAFKLALENFNSVSSAMALFIRESEFSQDDTLIRKVATALVYGIQTDTDGYQHASNLDFEALSFISPYSDSQVLDRITGLPMSGAVARLLEKAMQNRVRYRDWAIAGMGFIDESVRDAIAIIADFLLREENVEVSIVYAAIEKNHGKGMVLDASFRAKKEDLDLNYVIKSITDEGGARKFKGAFQVNLDYFTNCPDRALLWKLIDLTTMDVLKKKRDTMYIVELKGVYNRFKKRIRTFFEKLGIILIALALLGGCARKFGLVRSLAPVERLDTEVKSEGCALIRSRFFDVTAEAIDEKRWHAILAAKAFTTRKKASSETRFPRLVMFRVMISNVSDDPLALKKVKLAYGKEEKAALTVKQVREKCKSPAYDAFDFRRILAAGRLLRESNCMSEVDHDRDFIHYYFDIVNPGERIARIFAFEWVPVEHRTMTLRVEVELKSKVPYKKIIDFDFNRLEYRTRGKHFIRPSRQKREGTAVREIPSNEDR